MKSCVLRFFYCTGLVTVLIVVNSATAQRPAEDTGQDYLLPPSGHVTPTRDGTATVTPTPTNTPTTPPPPQQCVIKMCDDTVVGNIFDVNSDCSVTDADAQAIIDLLNEGKGGLVDDETQIGDVNSDQSLTPRDALLVINLVREKQAICEEDSTPTPTNTPTATATSTPTVTPTSTPTDTPTSTPTATATGTSTDTPTSTPTDTPTSTPTATPTSTPTSTPATSSLCPNYYRVDFQHIASSRAKEGRTWVDQRQAPELTCFADIMRNIVPEYQASKKTETWKETTPYLWAELLALVGSSPGKGDSELYESNKQYLNCTGGYQSPRADGHNAHRMIGGGQTPGKKGTINPGCESGSLFLGPDCKLIPISSVNLAESEANEGGKCSISLKAEVATPLSLIWSSAYKSEPATIVNFKLDPTSNQTSWMWRASGALPLLVHDPENTGVVTSATQLFGPWTFGGKNSDTGKARSTWRDGYEALASLDTNSDGVVAGTELAAISLWFDTNRDGVSQTGEVQRVTKLGISRLYFEPDRTEDGAPLASKGYERIVNGKSVQGRSIDWSEQSVTNEVHLSTGGLEQSDDARAALKGATLQESSPVSAIDQRLLGRWVWTIDGSEGGSGFLAFSGEEGGVSGITLNPIGIQNLGEVQAQVVFSHFVASLSKDRTGSTQVAFTAKGVSGAVLKNSASLSDDGQTMLGKTVVEGSHLAKSGSYQYTWRARKIS